MVQRKLHILSITRLETKGGGAMKARQFLMCLCSVAVLAFSTKLYAYGYSYTYLCPGLPVADNSQDRCICTTTNWSNRYREVTTEIFDADGNVLREATNMVPPSGTERIGVAGPFPTLACSCRVTINTKDARVALRARRDSNTRQAMAAVNCDLQRASLFSQ